MFNSVPPVITSPVNGTWMNVNKSSSLQLTCTGSGIPVPNIKWIHNGNTLRTSGPNAGSMTIGTTVVSQSLTYTITSADVNDNGWHTCMATRSLKGREYTAESKVYVNVQGESDRSFSFILPMYCKSPHVCFGTGVHCCHWQSWQDSQVHATVDFVYKHLRVYRREHFCG